MDIILYIIAIIFLVLSILVVCGNWIVFWRRYVSRVTDASWLPLVGGSAGVIGLLVFPGENASRYWFFPLLLDWGCVPGFAFTIWWYVVRKKGQKGRNP